MADITMCEPLKLYNLLNQCRCVSRLAEINYLCLIDARETRDYNTSHIITAKNVKMDSEGKFLLPVAVEVDSMQHVVVYDSNASCLQEQGRAVECAQVLAKASLYPVHIVRGGFQRFSALYPFLRTEKIMYTITELENLKTYPVEVIAGLLYMGDQKQGTDSSILKDLKIKAVISISLSDTLESRSIKWSQTILSIPVADSVESDLYSNFERICSFIGSHINMGSRVLIVSRQGRSRCSALTIAFLMHHLKYTLEEAWKYMLKCKPTMRPNTGFLQQLSEWELHTMGTKVTDMSEPHF
ncbi:serine/threonine/tyrosine-interacting-like protein 1 [Seriola lalandi dorsalis]|uniref:serine/threonine/tyrosine-interacting-like protein 1 n=1 Tax=Seriola lalandi dorsalis TaxID=1841481 RepID=UPI000C6FA4DA|nr:serine/threonine/tyrosine-interacting-like protein 1 [Seriola lalandi dorsalis]XP_056253150.1 serine/threonine/tyrosine-interacting-like protein 1 [Seriola aureovittata]